MLSCMHTHQCIIVWGDEKCARIAFPARHKVDNAVSCRCEYSICPLLQQVANVYNEGPLYGWHINPGA